MANVLFLGVSVGRGNGTHRRLLGAGRGRRFCHGDAFDDGDGTQRCGHADRAVRADGAGAGFRDRAIPHGDRPGDSRDRSVDVAVVESVVASDVE